MSPTVRGGSVLATPVGTMQRLLAAALIVAAACTSSDPSPGPPLPPEPILPGCASDRDCRGGETCRDGTCRGWAPDIAIGLPSCPRGCPASQVCADGVCVGHVTPDAGGEPFTKPRYGAAANAEPFHE